MTPGHSHAHRDYRRADAGWRYHPEQLATVNYAGHITQVSDDTAAFAILRVEVDERWPVEINPLKVPETPSTWP